MQSVSRAYQYILVESFIPEQTSGKHGLVHMRPVGGPEMFVSCSKKTRDLKTHPLGTRFEILAKVIDHGGEGEYLYSNPRDPIVVVGKRQP